MEHKLNVNVLQSFHWGVSHMQLKIQIRVFLLNGRWLWHYSTVNWTIQIALRLRVFLLKLKRSSRGGTDRVVWWWKAILAPLMSFQFAVKLLYTLSRACYMNRIDQKKIVSNWFPIIWEVLQLSSTNSLEVKIDFFLSKGDFPIQILGLYLRPDGN